MADISCKNPSAKLNLDFSIVPLRLRLDRISLEVYDSDKTRRLSKKLWKVMLKIDKYLVSLASEFYNLTDFAADGIFSIKLILGRHYKSVQL